MIFLKKLFHRPVGSKKKGSITVWLTLSFLVFLGLYLICLQSVQKQSAKRRAEQAVENGMFSLLSEYEPHLLDKWVVLYRHFLSGQDGEKRRTLQSSVEIYTGKYYECPWKTVGWLEPSGSKP